MYFQTVLLSFCKSETNQLACVSFPCQCYDTYLITCVVKIQCVFCFSQQFAVSPAKKLARSSFELHDTDPVTTEDLDKMLKGLAEFRDADYGDVASETKYPRSSTPPTPQESIPLSEIVGSLQRGFTMADEDLTGKYVRVCMCVCTCVCGNLYEHYYYSVLLNGIE